MILYFLWWLGVGAVVSSVVTNSWMPLVGWFVIAGTSLTIVFKMDAAYEEQVIRNSRKRRNG